MNVPAPCSAIALKPGVLRAEVRAATIPAMRGAPRKTSKEAVIAAARALFTEHGVEASSVAEIASAAGTAKGTFYHYFPSKESLVDALFRPDAEALLALVAGDGSRLRIAAIARGLLDFFSTRALFLSELRTAYRGRLRYGFVKLARGAFVPLTARYYRRDSRFAVRDLETYSELIVGAALDLCSYRLVQGRIADDNEALVMLEDLLKRFFDCEP